MAKTATLEVVSKNGQLAEKNAKRQKMVEVLTARIDAKNKELETKKYLIEGGTLAAQKIQEFLTNDAKWKFSEALGIMESTKQVDEALAQIKAGKTKELLVPALALEAIYYFLTKVEGTGLGSATNYIDILKPISDALGRSKKDREEVDQLVRDRGTLEAAIDNGADVEGEDSILKEIEAELEPQL